MPPDGEEDRFPPPLLEPVPEDSPEPRGAFAEMREWFETPRVPNVFRVYARRYREMLGYWGYWKAVFADRHLDRLTKEMVGYAAAVSVKSTYGIPFFTHLLRRRGVDDSTLLEIMTVVRHFNGITKLADLLQLESELTNAEIRDTTALSDARA